MRRRLVLLLATMGAMLALYASVAVAGTIQETLDANNLDDFGLFQTQWTGSALHEGQSVGQTFTAVHDGQLTSAQIGLAKHKNNPAFDLDSVEITAEISDVDSSGQPANVLASTTIPGSAVPTGDKTSLVKMMFENPPEVTAGQQYALTLNAPVKPLDGSFAVPATREDSYSGGGMLLRPPSTPWLCCFEDSIFTTYVTRDVDDTTPPAFSGVPTGPIIAEATSIQGAVVNYTEPTAYDAGDNASVDVTCAPASGSTFRLRTTTVDCWTADATGNIATAHFEVTVQDTTPPTIFGMPSDIFTDATGANGAQVGWQQPFARDLVDGTRPVNCTPTSGTIFAIGTTTVSCTATDTRNNTATKTFKVTVQDTTAPEVVAVNPDGTKVVPRASTVTANFSEAVQASTLTSNTVQLFAGNSTKPIKATLSWNPSTKPTSVTLTPSSKLDAKTKYTAKIKGGSNGVKDLAGNPLASDYSWSFTTGSM